jgi:CDP-paratose 2-epimerase
MKILITGICGFVGSTLAREWLKSQPDNTLYGIDNFSRTGSELNRIDLQQRGVILRHGDIRVTSDFEALPPVDWIIDAAAYPSVLAGIDGQISSRQLMQNNLLGTVNILEYCRQHGAGFIMLSSSRVYSMASLASLQLEVEDSAFRVKSGQLLPAGVSAAGVSEAFSTAPPLSLYGCSKLTSELLALEYGEAFGFPVWINRCGLLAGAGQFGRPDQGIVTYWINAWMRQLPLSYVGFGGTGSQVRDCLHPRDLLPLLKKQIAAHQPLPCRIYNVGGGTQNSFSLFMLSDWCRQRLGDHEVTGVPDARRFDVPWLVLDSSLAFKTWGWQPETSLEVILDEIVHHAASHPKWLEQCRSL